MNELMLFTDGSVNPRARIGYGAYLVVSELGESVDALRSRVKLKRFERTSSTKLELQTLLWALNDIQAAEKKIIIHTDSQNIVRLPERREGLEQNDYWTKNNKRLKNHELYKEFFATIDQLDCEFVKVCGHQKTARKNEIDKIFTLIDQASRNALRMDV